VACGLTGRGFASMSRVRLRRVATEAAQRSRASQRHNRFTREGAVRATRQRGRLRWHPAWRALLESYGMSRTDLAEAIGVNVHSVILWGTTDTWPSPFNRHEINAIAISKGLPPVYHDWRRRFLAIEMSREEMAKALGVPREAVERWFSGTTPGPSKRMKIDALALKLGLLPVFTIRQPNDTRTR